MIWYNPFTWFISLKSKIIAAVAICIVNIIIGWHIHSTVIKAEAYNSQTKQLERAQQAPAKISKFQQDLRKTNAEKTECWGTRMPDDVINLLR